MPDQRDKVARPTAPAQGEDEAPAPVRTDARAADSDPAAPSGVYEVMIDGWGYDPIHKRGDFITAADSPYDVEWGEKIGALRELPQAEAGLVAENRLESATQPVDEHLQIDLDRQRSARDAAGLPPPPADPHAPAKEQPAPAGSPGAPPQQPKPAEPLRAPEQPKQPPTPPQGEPAKP